MLWRVALLGAGMLVPLAAQVAGTSTTELPDSLFVFESPRPLLRTSPELPASWGILLTFSGNGFGGGISYQRGVTRTLAWAAELTISGARNSDEFEVYDPYTGTIAVPGKVNRLFLLPLSLSLQYFLFTESLDEAFSPLVAVGIVPALVVATPYEEEFFRAFRRAQLFGRFGAHIGLGAQIRYSGQSFLGIGLRYYTIPFGGAGLESIRGRPIRDFGGVVLSLRLPL
ncbi:hypothetical protein HRbin21_00595 [bacterium HR21]|jgi:hypothetical protein|nr:hypothetical protein HRbin21_00595 [bacterium HR21]